MKDLKERTIRGGAARLVGYAARSVVRLAALMTLARLLDPTDFGLVAMVTAVTGFLEVFATGGLSAATVQRAEVSHGQVSVLFWFNIAIGGLLAIICLAAAPAISTFYGDPRTALVIVAVAPAFLFNATGVQHLAILQRELRYVTLASIEVASEIIAASIAIGMALAGYGYWAIVASVVAGPLVITIGGWVTSGWLPGPPRWVHNVSSMLRFGGEVTAYGLVVYFTYNLEKILLGRYYGSDQLGLYGKANELINLPMRIISTAIGMVAFSSLARLQSEPGRLKTYFLKGYSLFVSITLPITVACVVFADDLILVVLGPKWTEAVDIFRLLAPSVLVLGLVQPLAWLLMALGLQGRNLKISLVLAPLAVCAYLVGLPYGPVGVAVAFSTTMVLWLVPHTLWSLRGTTISIKDLLAAAGRPAVAVAIAAVAAVSVMSLTQPAPAIARLALGGSAMFAVYAFVLLIVFGQAEFYLGLLRGLKANVLTSPRVGLQRPGVTNLS